MDSLILPEVNASVFTLFLEEVATRHAGSGFVIMFVDGAAWHTTKGLPYPLTFAFPFCRHTAQNSIPLSIFGIVYEKIGFQTRLSVALTQWRILSSKHSFHSEMDNIRVQGLTGSIWIVNNILIAT